MKIDSLKPILGKRTNSKENLQGPARGCYCTIACNCAGDSFTKSRVDTGKMIVKMTCLPMACR